MIDSFPHYIDAYQRPSMQMLMNEFGETAYIKWFALLEALGQKFNDSGDLHFNFSDREELSRAAAYIKLPPDELIKMMDFCAEVKMIDRDLWIDKIVWIQTHRDNLQKLHSRKRIDFPLKPGEIAPPPKEKTVASEATVIAEKILTIFEKRNPKVVDWSVAKKKKSIEAWASDIEKIHTVLKHEWEEIFSAWEYVEHLEKINDKFKYTILSGDSFRRKFDGIIANPYYHKYLKGSHNKGTFAGAL